jgi:site-specific DNA recombinase
MSDTAGVWKRLEKLGCELHAAKSGRLQHMLVGVLGALSQEELENLKYRLGTGIRQRAGEGRAIVGPVYGYTHQNKRLVVNPAQAAVVRRIFQMYADGLSAYKIADILNDEKIPTMRDRGWRGPGILGDPATLTGILRNLRYTGLLVYGRLESFNDPTTGVRKLRMRDPADWIVSADPSLRIVDAELFGRVQARLNTQDRKKERLRAARKKRKAGVQLSPEEQRLAQPRMKKSSRFLSGLVHCASCGSNMQAIWQGDTNKFRLGCNRYRTTGKCDSSRSILLELVELGALQMLQEEISTIKIVGPFVKEYEEQRHAISKRQDSQRRRLKNDIAHVEQELDASFDKREAATAPLEWLAAKRQKLWARAETARAELERLPENPGPAALNGDAGEKFMSSLGRIFQDPTIDTTSEDGACLLAQFRKLVDRIEIGIATDRTYSLRIAVRLAPLLTSEGSTSISDAVISLERKFPAFRRGSNPAEMERLRLIADKGTHKLTDAEWDLISDLVPERLGRSRREEWNLPVRTMVDAALFAIKTGTWTANLPSHFGDRRAVEVGVVRLVYGGTFDRIVHKLKASSPKTLIGANVSYFDRFKRREPQPKPLVPTAPGATASRQRRRRTRKSRGRKRAR